MKIIVLKDTYFSKIYMGNYFFRDWKQSQDCGLDSNLQRQNSVQNSQSGTSAWSFYTTVLKGLLEILSCPAQTSKCMEETFLGEQLAFTSIQLPRERTCGLHYAILCKAPAWGASWCHQGKSLIKTSARCSLHVSCDYDLPPSWFHLSMNVLLLPSHLLIGSEASLQLLTCHHMLETQQES